MDGGEDGTARRVHVGNELVGHSESQMELKSAKVYMDFLKKALVPWHKKKKLVFRKKHGFHVHMCQQPLATLVGVTTLGRGDSSVLVDSPSNLSVSLYFSRLSLHLASCGRRRRARRQEK